MIYTFYYDRYENATTSIELKKYGIPHTVVIHNNLEKFKTIETDKIIITGNERGLWRQRNNVLDNWIKKIEGFTKKEKDELIIKDNLEFGEWDWIQLKDNWETIELDMWGLDTPFSGGLFNKDVDSLKSKTEDEIFYRMLVIYDNDEQLQKFYDFTGILSKKSSYKKIDMTKWQ